MQSPADSHASLRAKCFCIWNQIWMPLVHLMQFFAVARCSFSCGDGRRTRPLELVLVQEYQHPVTLYEDASNSGRIRSRPVRVAKAIPLLPWATFCRGALNILSLFYLLLFLFGCSTVAPACMDKYSHWVCGSFGSLPSPWKSGTYGHGIVQSSRFFCFLRVWGTVIKHIFRAGQVAGLWHFIGGQMWFVISLTLAQLHFMSLSSPGLNEPHHSSCYDAPRHASSNTFSWSYSYFEDHNLVLQLWLHMAYVMVVPYFGIMTILNNFHLLTVSRTTHSKQEVYREPFCGRWALRIEQQVGLCCALSTVHWALVECSGSNSWKERRTGTQYSCFA